MKKSYCTLIIIATLINISWPAFLFGRVNNSFENKVSLKSITDTLDTLLETDVIKPYSLSSKFKLNKNEAHLNLQEVLTSQTSSVYVNQATGEPGVGQDMFLRGVSKPLFSVRDVYGTQPLVVLDGMPLIGDHPFAFDIQTYGFERIGPEINLLSHINLNDIESIHVKKDIHEISRFGSLASNGVIDIRTKSGSLDTIKRISLNSYFGLAPRPTVTTINGEYEDAFRKQFYNLYTSDNRYYEDDIYPIYLSDSLNSSYFGPSDWTDSYYSTGLNYGVDVSLSGGNERSKFHFTAGDNKSSGIGDETSLERLRAKFYLALKPFKNGLIETMVNANRINRTRNRNLTSRFSTTGYLPDLNAPLSPNNELYKDYLKALENGFDKNFSNILQGFVRLNARFDSFNYNAKLAVDYNEGFRDQFYPSTLVEGNNYASNYFGYNQRLLLDNNLSYSLNDKTNFFHIELGSMINWDTYKYNYSYAYKGVNDFIKLNLLNDDLEPTAFPHQLVYKFLDRTKHNLAAFYVHSDYNYRNKYQASLSMRYEGSSNAQPSNRWFFSPAASLSWNIKEEFYSSAPGLSDFIVRAGVGRVGSLNIADDFSQGPNYTAQIGYTGNKVVPSYNGIAALVRPYETGWVGYDIPWSYIDEVNLGTDINFKSRSLFLSLNLYSKNHKNQLLLLPTLAEYGYKNIYESGMDVKNMGVELFVGLEVLKKREFLWGLSTNIAYNTNKLTRLPLNLEQVSIGDHMLKVGERVDRFWLLENSGIYLSDEEVGEANGVKTSYNGIKLKAGDPIWTDLNNDNVINDNDRLLYGNVFPKVIGTFSNNFKFKEWDLSLDFHFNLGREALYEEMSKRFNFIENENANTLNSIKEITYWEKRGDYSKYPLYNPWSSVSPYQLHQTLFLENASFLKLRNISIGYNATDFFKNKFGGAKSVYVYFSARNILTFSSYSGRDPELVNSLGIDSGLALPIPKTFSLGFTINL